MNCIKEFDYDVILQEKFALLQNVSEMVLSTSVDNHVTSRVVSTACYGPRIIFLSWGHHTKCRQIKANSRVALCHDTFQIEGTASIKGGVLEAGNADYARLYRAKQERFFTIFSGFPGMQVIEVEIQRMACFGFEGPTFFLDRIDLISKTARRENLEMVV